MAVDYLHRLVVMGPREQVRALRRQMRREYPRTVGKKTWTEIVPFSFAALYDLAPSARRVEHEIPFDPYELSVWPVRRIDDRRAEVRYQFHTRNLEMAGLLRALAKALPSLTFTVATLCFDDSSIESSRLSRGTARRWILPPRRQEFHWNRGRRKFGLAGDAVYDEYGAEYWAEREMLRDALTHWDAAGTPPRGRYSWDNQPCLRDLESERELALYELAALHAPKASRGKRKAKSARKRRKGTRRSAR